MASGLILTLKIVTNGYRENFGQVTRLQRSKKEGYDFEGQTVSYLTNGIVGSEVITLKLFT